MSELLDFGKWRPRVAKLEENYLLILSYREQGFRAIISAASLAALVVGPNIIEEICANLTITTNGTHIVMHSYNSGVYSANSGVHEGDSLKKSKSLISSADFSHPTSHRFGPEHLRADGTVDFRQSITVNRLLIWAPGPIKQIFYLSNTDEWYPIENSKFTNLTTDPEPTQKMFVTEVKFSTITTSFMQIWVGEFSLRKTLVKSERLTQSSIFSCTLDLI